MANKTWDCPKCGTKNIDGMFCPECGAKNTAPKLYCATCEKEIETKFCTKCGNRSVQIIDRGSYIELSPAIGDLHLIAKERSKDKMYWKKASEYEKNFKLYFNLYNLAKWRIPTEEELLIIYKIKDLCGISDSEEFWTSTYAGEEKKQEPNFPWGTDHITINYNHTVDFSSGRVGKTGTERKSYTKYDDGSGYSETTIKSCGCAYVRLVW